MSSWEINHFGTKGKIPVLFTIEILVIPCQEYNISGYLFDKIKDFDKLRVEMRILEQDHVGSNNIPCKSVTGERPQSEMKEMKTMI